MDISGFSCRKSAVSYYIRIAKETKKYECFDNIDKNITYRQKTSSIMPRAEPSPLVLIFGSGKKFYHPLDKLYRAFFVTNINDSTVSCWLNLNSAVEKELNRLIV